MMEHDFTHPRNLYEKLERDYSALNQEITGDNFFNFITTACHLKHWIKTEDTLKSDATITRLVKRLNDDPQMRMCSEILEARKRFKITTDAITNQIVADLGDERIPIKELKDEIMGIYQTYFLVKG